MKERLKAVRDILCMVEVHGEQNMVWLLGSIQTLSDIIREVAANESDDPAE